MRSLLDVLSTPAGRAYFFNIAAEAEDSDGGRFVGMAERCPRNRGAILRHAADEERHAKILRECVARNGGTSAPVAPELQLFERLLEAAGELAESVPGFFSMLQVAEERAAMQYAAIGALISELDPESAIGLTSIAADEASHIEHCRALAKRYATEPAIDLGELRAIEGRVFGDFARAVFEGAP